MVLLSQDRSAIRRLRPVPQWRGQPTVQRGTPKLPGEKDQALQERRFLVHRSRVQVHSGQNHHKVSLALSALKVELDFLLIDVENDSDHSFHCVQLCDFTEKRKSLEFYATLTIFISSTR